MHDYSDGIRISGITAFREQTRMAFDGFGKSAFSFFRQLEKNNSREWFTPRKETFENDVRAPMIELVTAVNDALRKFAVDYVVEQPAKAIFRIYRDTRFSKDKTPYKTHIAASFYRKGMPKHHAAGFYFGVSHKEIEIAGGMYMPGPEQLAGVRAALAADFKSLAKLTADKKLVKAMGPLLGQRSARVPKGFDPDHPAADWLKMKQFYYYVGLKPEAAMSRSLVKEIVDRFKLLKPAVDWLNDAATDADDGESDVVKRPDPMW